MAPAELRLNPQAAAKRRSNVRDQAVVMRVEIGTAQADGGECGVDGRVLRREIDLAAGKKLGVVVSMLLMSPSRWMPREPL